MPTSILQRVRTRLGLGVAITALLSASAFAQSSDISLPAQPLADSLAYLSQKSGENILIRSDLVSGLRAPALNGRMTAREAVEKLIRGTNLKVNPDGRGGLVIERDSFETPAAPVRPQQNSIQLAQASSPAPPPPSVAASPDIEQVVVSASRISIGGYQAPTPVTVVGAAELERNAQSDIGKLLRDLPAFGGSTSPDNSNQAALVGAANGGLNEVSLRNLGVLRTLVLVNGQRMVPSDILEAVPDLSTIPTTLLKRVDVVTGGASASWGSDAVAGVVNLILDTNLEGFRANIQGNDNAALNHESVKFDAAYGVSLDGGRAHLILSGSYYDSPRSFFANEAPWAIPTALVSNPAYAVGNGQPALVHSSDHVGSNTMTVGGLISSGPLKGIQFVGPTGTPAPFNFGNVSSGALSNGGSAESTLQYNQFSVPIRTKTAFIYASYKLTDNISASLQLNYGGSHVENGSTFKADRGDITITADNPYIPAPLATQMAAQHITSFKLGTDNLNNVVPNEDNLGSKAQSLSYVVVRTDRQLLRGVLSLDGAIGDDWSWNAYYQHGVMRLYENVLNNVHIPNYNNAIDAVLVTAANVGSSGLPIGTIACRSTLAHPTNGCQPLDLFGVGVASPAAIQYIEGPVRAGGDWQTQIINEDVVEASMQGALPWGLPAGHVTVAFGGTYRKEAAREQASPLAEAQVLVQGNFSTFAGTYNTKEGYAEIGVPVLKNDILQSLDLNMAGRLTDYSTSGLVESWKLGLTSQVNDDVRLRTTWSYDIRAPNIYELDLNQLYRIGSDIDPKTGLQVTDYHIQGGNPHLVPEDSVTVSGGVVLTPHWFAGLNISMDWYSISLKKAIVTVNFTTVVDNCRAGQALYCAQLEYNGPGGSLSGVHYGPINADSQTVSGLDFQADYGMNFLGGQLNYHMVANYVDEQTQTTQGVVFDYAGSIGGNSPYVGVPKFKSTLAATYDVGPWSATLQGRFIGTARLNNAWGLLDVDYNDVPAIAYLDLRASYNWNENIQLYGAIDNALDAPPPIVAADAGHGGGGAATRTDLYDVYGRLLRLGIRLRY